MTILKATTSSSKWHDGNLSSSSCGILFFCQLFFSFHTKIKKWTWTFVFWLFRFLTVSTTKPGKKITVCYESKEEQCSINTRFFENQSQTPCMQQSFFFVCGRSFRSQILWMHARRVVPSKWGSWILRTYRLYSVAKVRTLRLINCCHLEQCLIKKVTKLEYVTGALMYTLTTNPSISQWTVLIKIH